MARAKHRDKILLAQVKAFKAYCDRQEKHEELLEQHRFHKHSKAAGIA